MRNLLAMMMMALLPFAVGHAQDPAAHPTPTPSLMPVARDSLIDVIVEFTEEPQFILSSHSSAAASAPRYLDRRAEFPADLNRQGITAFGLSSDRFYHKVFYGAALALREHDIRIVERLPYVKKIHRAKSYEAHLEKSLRQIHAREAWSAYAVKGSGVLVAIIDSGIDYLHPALGGGIGPGFTVTGGYDFVNHDPDPMDDNGHGTHVAGIIAANAGDLQGVAPLSRLLAYKVLNDRGRGREADILAAIERLADPDQNGDPSDRPDVVNMSLGSDYGDPDDALSTAVDNATRLGITFCISAGNAGRYTPYQGKEDNYYYTAMESVGSPGTARLAITVAAVDSLERRAEYSSKGPAGGTFAIKPDVSAPGDMIWSLAPGGGYALKSGTSMASPMAAGIAALLLSRDKTLTPAAIKAILMNSARDLGLPVLQQGAGRVDALRALGLTTRAFPGHLSFGLDDASATTWTTTDTLLIENRAATAQEYSWSVAGSGSGVGLTASPSAFTLMPNDARQVVITLSVNNAVVPLVDEDIRIRDGLVFLNGTKDTIGIPWAFARTSQMLLSFAAPGPSFIGAGENSVILPVAPKLGPKVRWIDKLHVQVAGATAGAYDFLVSFPGTGALIVREQLPFTGSAAFHFDPAEAVHTVQLQGTDDTGAPFPPTEHTQRTLVASLPSGYALYGRFPTGSASLPISPASARVAFLPVESHFDWRDGGRVVLPQYAAFRGIGASSIRTPSGSGYVKQLLSFTLPPGTSMAKFYADVIAIETMGGQEFFNPVQIDYDTLQTQGAELRLHLSMMGHQDPAHYTSLAFHINASDLSTDVLDYSTRYLTVSNDSILASLPSQRSPVISAFPNGGTMHFGRAPLHILSLSYNNLSGTSIQFTPNFRGSLLEDRYHDARRGTYVVYNAGWHPVHAGSIIAPREPIALPAAWHHLVLTSDNYFVRGFRGAVTLTNSVNLAHAMPDPPFITSFAVLGGDGLPTDSTGHESAPSLRFSSRLPMPGTLPVIDSTRVFYRSIRSGPWIPLTVSAHGVSGSGVGTIFTSSLAGCTGKDSSAVDLRIRVVDEQGHASDMTVSPAFVVGAWNGGDPTGVEETGDIPLAFALAQNYPNPFNPSTVIRYTVGGGGGARTRTAILTRLQVFDLLGRHVATLVDEMKEPGDHEVRFEAAGLATGIYFYRLSAGGFVQTRTMILMR